MSYNKEKRNFERISIPNVSGAVEIRGGKKEVMLVNACEGGVCISGPEIKPGTVLRLHLENPEEENNIALYCKVVWATNKKKNGSALSGLALLNTNKILFESELESYGKLIAAIAPE